MATRKRRPHYDTKPPLPEPVVIERQSIKVLNPLVRTEALRLAGGDPLRVHVINETEALVRNE